MDYQELSDVDLIRYYCEGDADQAAFNELWRRYEPVVHRFTKHLICLCPECFSREIFEEDVFSETQERIVRQIRGFQRRVPFSAWLWMICQGVAIDARRRITGRDPRIPRAFVSLAEDELARSRAVLKDKAKQDPVRVIFEHEQRSIVAKVFSDYSKTPEGFESLSALYLHFGEDCRVAEVAQMFATYERRIFRMFCHDCDALRDLFTQVGIRNLQEILAD